MMSVIMIHVVGLSIVMLSVVMLSVAILNLTLQRDIMPNATLSQYCMLCIILSGICAEY